MQDPAGYPGNQLHGLEAQVENVAHPGQLNVAEDCGDSLGDDGCQSNARDTHILNQQQVQNHIQGGGQQQEAESRHAVAKTSEDAGEHIIEEEAHDAQEVDVQVIPAVVDDGLGSAQQLQHGHCDQGTHDHDHDACDEGHADAVADGFGEALPVSGAEALGYHDACAGGDTDKQGQQQIQNGAGTAYCCQGGVALVLTDDNGVGGVIKLLRQISKQHRNGKFHDPLPGRTKGHILGGKECFQAHFYVLLINVHILFYYSCN